MKHRIWVGRPVWAYVGALFLMASAAIASCYNGDQSCAEAYNPNDLGDHCPYGPPGGPKPGAFPSDCPTIQPLSGAACDGVTWDVVHAMLLDTNRGNCVDPTKSCHANDIGNIPSFVLDPANPLDPADTGAAFLDALASYNGNFGNAYPTVKGTEAIPRLYYDRDDPGSSWWICNLKGDAGSLMPRDKARITEADIELLETWLACGAADDPGL